MMDIDKITSQHGDIWHLGGQIRFDLKLQSFIKIQTTPRLGPHIRVIKRNLSIRGFLPKRPLLADD